jgi:hypothetical protein
MIKALRSTLLPRRNTMLAALVMAAIAATAHADSVTLVNGDFSQLAMNASAEFGANNPSQQVTGWTGSGLAFVYLPGTIDTTGAPLAGDPNPFRVWGPNTGSNNGLTPSPAGGNIIALDGDQTPGMAGTISQTLTGLTVGDTVTVSFYFAGAQQSGYIGNTTEQLEVSLGGQNDFTPVLQNTSEGFTGWNTESLTFTPTSTSETLTFLAIGTPVGEPPISLLSDVTVSEASPVPEPASLSLMATGLVGIAGLARSRFKSQASNTR